MEMDPRDFELLQQAVGQPGDHALQLQAFSSVSDAGDLINENISAEDVERLLQQLGEDPSIASPSSHDDREYGNFSSDTEAAIYAALTSGHNVLGEDRHLHSTDRTLDATGQRNEVLKYDFPASIQANGNAVPHEREHSPASLQSPHTSRSFYHAGSLVDTSNHQPNNSRGSSLEDQADGIDDIQKAADKERIREENRERKKRWRESNQDRNKDNDLRCRVTKRANKIFGNNHTQERSDWIQEEFNRRKNKREQKGKTRHDGPEYNGTMGMYHSSQDDLGYQQPPPPIIDHTRPLSSEIVIHSLTKAGRDGVTMNTVDDLVVHLLRNTDQINDIAQHASLVYGNVEIWDLMIGSSNGHEPPQPREDPPSIGSENHHLGLPFQNLELPNGFDEVIAFLHRPRENTAPQPNNDLDGNVEESVKDDTREVPMLDILSASLENAPVEEIERLLAELGDTDDELDDELNEKDEANTAGCDQSGVRDVNFTLDDETVSQEIVIATRDSNELSGTEEDVLASVADVFPELSGVTADIGIENLDFEVEETELMLEKVIMQKGFDPENLDINALLESLTAEIEALPEPEPMGIDDYELNDENTANEASLENDNIVQGTGENQDMSNIVSEAGEIHDYELNDENKVNKALPENVAENYNSFENDNTVQETGETQNMSNIVQEIGEIQDLNNIDIADIDDLLSKLGDVSDDDVDMIDGVVIEDQFAANDSKSCPREGSDIPRGNTLMDKRLSGFETRAVPYVNSTASSPGIAGDSQTYTVETVEKILHSFIKCLPTAPSSPVSTTSRGIKRAASTSLTQPPPKRVNGNSTRPGAGPISVHQPSGYLDSNMPESQLNVSTLIPPAYAARYLVAIEELDKRALSLKPPPYRPIPNPTGTSGVLIPAKPITIAPPKKKEDEKKIKAMGFPPLLAGIKRT